MMRNAILFAVVAVVAVCAYYAGQYGACGRPDFRGQCGLLDHKGKPLVHWPARADGSCHLEDMP
jgi:hypothetical protein